MGEPHDPFHAELLSYRMNLSLPVELDCRKSVVEYWLEEGEHGCRYVRTSYPIGNSSMQDPQQPAAERRENDRRAREDAGRKWLEKYGVPMPAEVEVSSAETMFARNLPYDGPTQLTAAEQLALERDVGDFTLDMVWLVVEGLGWRPGVPVPEDDDGWVAIWAEDYACACYLDIIRDVLGMSESPWWNDRSWVPPAVAKLPGYRSIARECA
ncbi:hypothetical protein [Ralstonia insidiosa]|jgi:hypothetical protein|nr:hypothetical protein [Ralstonia insidiosa]MBA9940573.1 hypothetical protein [Ralstonia insidiosa]MBC9968976.1 hypothetical protein [Ralstonia insidiosa]MBX3905059.1 hypothetical protein [Ralstonia insidiosa]